MKKNRLIPLSRLKPPTEHVELDSIRLGHRDERTRAFHILMEAQHYYDNMAQFRRERERNKKYTYGDQWSDIVEDKDDGEKLSEEAYILKQGNVPLKNNLIRRLVKATLGVFRSQSKEPTCVARDREEQKQGEYLLLVDYQYFSI